MGQRTHIVIAEPSLIIRSGIASVLKRMTTLTIDIAEISEIALLSERLSKLQPDILIIDPSHLGVFSLQQIKNEIGHSSLKAIALQNTLVDTSSLKHYDDVILIYDTADTIKNKLLALIESKDKKTNKQELSEREKDVVICVVKGLTNKQIAEELYVSTHTIMAHRRNIANKLGIHSTAGLTIFAIVNKLININEIETQLGVDNKI